MIYAPGVYGAFSFGSKTAAAGTEFLSIIPPRTLQGSAVGLLAVASNIPTWWSGTYGYSHITKLVYTTAGTVHALQLLRPLNWTTANGAVAPNATSLTLAANPGTYSTNYRYPKTSTTQGPAAIADNNIAANDFIACQLVDGSWFFSKVTSVSSLTLTLTTATPNVTGGGIADGTPIFFFGAPGDSDPATGVAQFSTTTTASQTRQTILEDTVLGAFHSLHPGDPLLFYSPNTTAAGTLDYLAGYYSKF